MYGLPDRLRPLSAAEEQVMLAVWACREPATRRDIDEKLRGKGWAPATVLNFLYRLEEKGWVKAESRATTTFMQPRSPSVPTVCGACASGWTPSLAGTLPQPCGRWSVRAAAGRANWNRP